MYLIYVSNVLSDIPNNSASVLEVQCHSYRERTFNRGMLTHLFTIYAVAQDSRKHQVESERRMRSQHLKTITSKHHV